MPKRWKEPKPNLDPSYRSDDVDPETASSWPPAPDAEDVEAMKLGYINKHDRAFIEGLGSLPVGGEIRDAWEITVFDGEGPDIDSFHDPLFGC